MKLYLVGGLWLIAYALFGLAGIGVIGLVLAKGWSWFVAPLTGWREISVVEGVGLMFFLGTAGMVITGPFQQWNSKSEPGKSPHMIAAEGLVMIAAIGIVAPLAGLAIEWVWHAFVIAPPGY